MRPVRAKALLFAWSFKAFALTGRQACVRHYPGRCPGLGASALSGRMGAMHSNTSALYLSLRPVTVGSGRVGAMHSNTSALYLSLRPVTVGSGRVGANNKTKQQHKTTT